MQFSARKECLVRVLLVTVIELDAGGEAGERVTHAQLCQAKLVERLRGVNVVKVFQARKEALEDFITPARAHHRLKLGARDANNLSKLREVFAATSDSLVQGAKVRREATARTLRRNLQPCQGSRKANDLIGSEASLGCASSDFLHQGNDLLFCRVRVDADLCN